MSINKPYKSMQEQPFLSETDILKARILELEIENEELTSILQEDWQKFRDEFKYD